MCEELTLESIECNNQQSSKDSVDNQSKEDISSPQKDLEKETPDAIWSESTNLLNPDKISEIALLGHNIIQNSTFDFEGVYQRIIEAAERMINASDKMMSSLLSSFQSVMEQFDYTSILERMISVFEGIDFGLYNDVYLQALFEAKWFPYAEWNSTLDLSTEIGRILDEVQSRSKREKCLDEAIFRYYTKTRIEKLRKQWRLKETNRVRVRIMNQAVYAYHRKEYVLTVNTLATLWEGIIQEKVNDVQYRQSRRTKENLSELIKENDYFEIFVDFFNEFVFYDCYGPDDVKEDVPGRHGIAHSWYKKYPSQKAALNAILITDFLLELKPKTLMER